MDLYLSKLLLLMPILMLLIWASLKLTQYTQRKLSGSARNHQSVRVVETTLLAPGVRLVVVQFHDREILIGCSRNGLTRLAETPAGARKPDFASAGPEPQK